MAAKKIKGNGGSFTHPTGWNAVWNTWSITLDTGVEETTTFDSSGHSEFEATGLNFSGSVGGFVRYDDSSTAPIPAALADGAGLTITDLDACSGAATLTATTGCTYAGTMVLSNVSLSRSAKGVMTITANFNFSGFVTQTWDQTA